MTGNTFRVTDQFCVGQVLLSSATDSQHGWYHYKLQRGSLQKGTLSGNEPRGYMCSVSHLWFEMAQIVYWHIRKEFSFCFLFVCFKGC